MTHISFIISVSGFCFSHSAIGRIFPVFFLFLVLFWFFLLSPNKIKTFPSKFNINTYKCSTELERCFLPAGRSERNCIWFNSNQRIIYLFILISFFPNPFFFASSFQLAFSFPLPHGCTHANTKIIAVQLQEKKDVKLFNFFFLHIFIHRTKTEKKRKNLPEQ